MSPPILPSSSLHQTRTYASAVGDRHAASAATRTLEDRQQLATALLHITRRLAGPWARTCCPQCGELPGMRCPTCDPTRQEGRMTALYECAECPFRTRSRHHANRHEADWRHALIITHPPPRPVATPAAPQPTLFDTQPKKEGTR